MLSGGGSLILRFIYYNIRIMGVITLSKTKYEILEKKAALYEKFFKKMAEMVFETEDYSSRRIQEFLKEDKVSKATKQKIEKILKS